MSLQEIIKARKEQVIGNQKVHKDGYCSNFGFCMRVACPFADTCDIIKTPLLLHCIIVDEKHKIYYPILYTNEIPLIPQDVKVENTIVEQCSSKEGCSQLVYYSCLFKDTYMRYAKEQGKLFFVYCSKECMEKAVQEYVEKGYKCKLTS